MSEAEAGAAHTARGDASTGSAVVGETANDSVGTVIGMIDFGMVGQLDESLRRALLRLVILLVRRDTNRLVDALLALGIARGQVNRQALKRDLDHFIGTYYDRPIKDLAAGKVLDDVVQVAFRHRLQFPSDLMLLFKLIAMSEGLGVQLDPSFKLLEFAEPYFKKFWLESRGPGALAAQFTQSALDLAELAPDLPLRAARLLGALERSDIEKCRTITPRAGKRGARLFSLRRSSSRWCLPRACCGLSGGQGGDEGAHYFFTHTPALSSRYT